MRWVFCCKDAYKKELPAENLLRVLRRLAYEVNINLDDVKISKSSKVISFEIDNVYFELDHTLMRCGDATCYFINDDDYIFKWIVQQIEKYSIR